MNAYLPFLALGRPGLWELLLVLFIILLLFGSKRLPDLARSLGKAIQEFRGARAEHEPPRETHPTTPESDS